MNKVNLKLTIDQDREAFTTQVGGQRVIDRKIDTLIGISKGLLADGVIVQTEVEFLQSWLIQNADNMKPTIIDDLLGLVSGYLEDGVLCDIEATMLHKKLSDLTGESSEVGELAKPATLGASTAPKIDFTGVFLFTGTFNSANRAQCERRAQGLGGTVSKSLTKKVQYLIVGDYNSKAWIHESFGRKIEKATELKRAGQDIHIITEQHWLSEMARQGLCTPA